jgi:hypothetical protein
MKVPDRPTMDILILLVAGTICVTVLISTFSIVIIEVVNPESDTSAAANIISDTINTLIGLLAGFIAGKTSGRGDL